MSNTSFRTSLSILINKYSMENGSNTPDFILAAYYEGNGQPIPSLFRCCRMMMMARLC